MDNLSLTSDTVESIITNTSHTKKDNTPQDGKSIAHLTTIIDTMQTNMKQLNESITTMDLKIDQHISTTTKEIHQTEENYNLRLDLIQKDTNQSIQAISKTFLDQLHLNQDNTSSLILSILEKGEESLISKIHDQIKIALHHNDGTNRSPTRKRNSPNNTTTETGSHITNDTIMESNEISIGNSGNEINNPNHKDNLRCRNVAITLPTTTN
jgi:hypothetical protein